MKLFVLKSHMTFVYLQRNIHVIDNNKVTTSDICKTNDFVITTEPLGFVLPKPVGGFLLRVYPVGNCLILPNNCPYSLSLLTVYMGKHGLLYSYIFLKQDMANPIAPDNAILFCAGQDILQMYTAARTHTLVRSFSVWPSCEYLAKNTIFPTFFSFLIGCVNFCTNGSH